MGKLGDGSHEALRSGREMNPGLLSPAFPGPCTQQESGFPPPRAEPNSLGSVPGLLAAQLQDKVGEGKEEGRALYSLKRKFSVGHWPLNRCTASGPGLCLPHPRAQALMFLINITTVNPLNFGQSRCLICLMPFASEVTLLSACSL